MPLWIGSLRDVIIYYLILLVLCGVLFAVRKVLQRRTLLRRILILVVVLLFCLGLPLHFRYKEAWQIHHAWDLLYAWKFQEARVYLEETFPGAEWNGPHHEDYVLALACEAYRDPARDVRYARSLLDGIDGHTFTEKQYYFYLSQKARIGTNLTYPSQEEKDPAPRKQESSSEESSSRPKRKPFTSKEEDDLRVGDFTDPEDFYEWNYDDFVDYEEAEEYYYEHGGR